MEPQTVKVPRHNPRGEMLECTALAVHPDLYKAINVVDRASIANIVHALLTIGSPEVCRERTRQKMRCTGLHPPATWALDGVLGGCPHGAAVPALAREEVDGHGPPTYEGIMAAVYHQLFDAARQLTNLVKESAPHNLVDADKTAGHHNRRYVPPRLLRRLLPVIYAWVVDWEFLCSKPVAWKSMVELLKRLCPQRTCYIRAATADDDDGGTDTTTTAGTDHQADQAPWEQLCTLPWKPFLDMVVSMADHRTSDLLLVDPSLTTCTSSEHVDLLLGVAPHVRCYFGPDALVGLWRALAPLLSVCELHAPQTRLYVTLLGRLLPIAHLSTVRLAGCRFPGRSSEDAVQPLPHPILNDMITAVLETNHQVGSYVPRHHVDIYALLSSIAKHNVGLMSFDTYAEPLFTALLAIVRLPTSQSPHPSRGGTQASDFGALVDAIAYGLPADTSSPLWNHLRRFVRAEQPLLRPETAFRAHATHVHGCLSALVKSVCRRVQAQNRAAASARRHSRHVWPDTLIVHRIDVPSHHWTTATREAFVELLAPLAIAALAMEVVNRAQIVHDLTELAPAVMLPHVEAFTAVSLSGHTSDVATREAFIVLRVVTALLLECVDTQARFLSLCQSVLDRVVEAISLSSPQVTTAALRWLGVIAATTPLLTLTNQSTHAEVIWVHDVVHRVLRSMRGLTTLTPVVREHAACLTLFLDGASDEAFADAVELIIAECQVESNGLFAIAIARQCALRSPAAFLPLLETAAGPLRAPYAESREPQLQWATSLAASVIAGCGFHVFPMASVIVECIESQLRYVTHSFCVNIAAELVHQLVRALTRRRCLGKGRRVFPTPCATGDDSATKDAEGVDSESDYEEDEPGGMAMTGAPHGTTDTTESGAIPLSSGVSLWLTTNRRAAVVWQDPTEAQAAYGAQLLHRLMAQALAFLRDPSPSVVDDPASAVVKGLDTARGAQAGGDGDTWHASRVAQGVVNWLAELWGAGAALYTATSLASLELSAKCSPALGTVMWHDDQGRPVTADAWNDLDPVTRRAQNPAPLATLKGLERYPRPCTDVELVSLLVDVVLPRCGAGAVDIVELLPPKALDGVVNATLLARINGSAPQAPTPVARQAEGLAELQERTPSAPALQAPTAVVAEVAHLLGNVVGSSCRVAGTDENSLVMARCQILTHMGRTASGRFPAGVFAEVAAVEELSMYLTQHHYDLASVEAKTRVFEAMQLLILCPHPAVRSAAVPTLITMLCGAAPAVHRLAANAVTNLIHRVLVVTSELAPNVIHRELASPLLADDVALTELSRPHAPSSSFHVAPLGTASAQRALADRLRGSLRGLLSVGTHIVMHALTGCDGAVLTALVSALTRMSVTFFKSTDVMQCGSAGMRLESGPTTNIFLDSTESAVAMEHAIRLAWLTVPVSPSGAEVLLHFARRFCAPTLRLFFWRQNHADPAVSRHAVGTPTQAAAAPVMPAALHALLLSLVGNASPNICGAALAVLLPQWLLFYESPARTYVMARVTADGVPCAMEQGAQSAPFFHDRVKKLAHAFTTVVCQIVSPLYLPQTLCVAATADAVQHAFPDFEQVTAHQSCFEAPRRYTRDVLRAVEGDDPAAACLAAARDRYRATLRTWCRGSASRSVTMMPSGEAAAAEHAVPLRKSWLWRLVRWTDEMTQTKTVHHRRTESAMWPLLAMAHGTDTALLDLSEVIDLALADAVADAHAAQSHLTQDTDKLHPTVLCQTVMWMVCALLRASRAPRSHVAVPTSACAANSADQRSSSLALLTSVIARLCDWRLAKVAAAAALRHCTMIWDSLSLDEARRMMHLFFDRLEPQSNNWAEQSVYFTLLSALFGHASTQEKAMCLVSEAGDRLLKMGAFFLTVGAAHEVNTPVIFAKRLLYQGTMMRLLDPQWHHVSTCETVKNWILDACDAALATIEQSSGPVEDRSVFHRQDLAVVKSCLWMQPLAWPYPMSGAAVSRTILLTARALDLTLPQVDSTAHLAERALLTEVKRAMPKAAAQEVLDFLCNLLLDRHVALGSAARTKTVLGLAVEVLLFTNLHRIGKYAAMRHVASAAQMCMAHRDSRVQTQGREMMSAIVRVATDDQIRAMSSTYLAELREVRMSGSPHPLSGSSVEASTPSDGVETDEVTAVLSTPRTSSMTITRSQLSVVMALCAIVLAYPTDFPSFLPVVMRRLAGFARVPMAQHAVRQTFRAWWDSHRRLWQIKYREAFSAEDAREFSTLWNANYYA